MTVGINFNRMVVAAKYFAKRHSLNFDDEKLNRIHLFTVSTAEIVPLYKLCFVDGLGYPYDRLFTLLQMLPENHVNAFNIFKSDFECDLFVVGAAIFNKPILDTSFLKLLLLFEYYGVNSLPWEIWETPKSIQVSLVFMQIAQKAAESKFNEIIKILYINLFLNVRKYKVPKNISILAYSFYLHGTSASFKYCVETYQVAGILKYLPTTIKENMAPKEWHLCEMESFVLFFFEGQNDNLRRTQC